MALLWLLPLEGNRNMKRFATFSSYPEPLGDVIDEGSRENPFQEKTASRKRKIQPPDSRDRKNSECTYLKAKTRSRQKAVCSRSW